jgi:hypothetical protein
MTWTIEVSPIALYAAIVATIVLLWDIYKWRTDGPSLRGSAKTDMIDLDDDDRIPFIYLTVNNVGTAPTTITLVLLYAYANWFQYLRGRPCHEAIVNHALAQTIPYKLEPGERFMSRVLQKEKRLEEWSRKYRLYMGVQHTMQGRQPFLARVPPCKADPDAD